MAYPKLKIVCSCSTTQQAANHRHAAKMRITRNSVWLRLEIDSHSSVPILIDTGAGLSIIRNDELELWKKLNRNALTFKEE